MKRYWFEILVSLVFLAIVYWLAWLVASEEKELSFSALGHRYLLLGGAVVLIAQILGQANFYRGSNIHQISATERILSGIGVVAAFGLVTGQISLVAFAVLLPNAGFIQSGLAGRIEGLFWMNLALLGITSLIFWKVWIRYTVANGRIALINGKLFYPGEKFSFFPAMGSQLQRIDQNLAVYFDDLYLEFQDGHFWLNVKVMHYLPLYDWKERNIRSLDYAEFVRQVKRWDEQQLKRLARQSSLGQFLRSKEFCIQSDALQWPWALTRVEVSLAQAKS